MSSVFAIRTGVISRRFCITGLYTHWLLRRIEAPDEEIRGMTMLLGHSQHCNVGWNNAMISYGPVRDALSAEGLLYSD